MTEQEIEEQLEKNWELMKDEKLSAYKFVELAEENKKLMSKLTGDM